MNLTSYLVNKCFEYLLNCNSAPTISRSTSTTGHPIRPPWTQTPHLFKSKCNGCGTCLLSCPNNILVADDGGFPKVDFSVGSCDFCGACAENCPQGAFRSDRPSSAWSIKAFITGNCLAHNNVVCRTCEEHCEKNAILVPKANGTINPPRIKPEQCNGCGACFAPCPVRAIEISDSEKDENHNSREVR